MKSQGVDKAQKPQGVQSTQHVQQAQQIQKMDAMRHVDQVQKADKAGLQKLDKNATAKAMDPVTQKNEVNKSTSMVSNMIAGMEKGAVNIDQIINSGLSGKNFNNQELLSLQAGMYKYTQELDLCSKVVEKATSGLKDTLKTQV